MSIKDLCAAYLAALNSGDLDAVKSMFTPDGIVVSPLYGTGPADAFYEDLFADTNLSDTTLLNVYEPAEGAASVALHFRYVWTLSNGKVVSFECVDVFELSEDRQKFQKLTIIYDTAPLRGEFDAARSKA